MGNSNLVRCCLTWRCEVNGEKGPAGISYNEVDAEGKVCFARCESNPDPDPDPNPNPNPSPSPSPNPNPDPDPNQGVLRARHPRSEHQAAALHQGSG